MANLFQCTVIKHDMADFNPASDVWLNSHLVVDCPSVVYVDSDGDTQIGTLIQYNAFRKNMPHFITVTEAPSTILAAINDDLTGDPHVIAITEIAFDAPSSGYIAQVFKKATSVAVKDIWWLQANPLNTNGDGLLIVQNQVRTTMQTIRTEESADDIATLANDNT